MPESTDRPGALAAVGDTPLVRLVNVVEPGRAEVRGKLEGLKDLRGEVHG